MYEDTGGAQLGGKTVAGAGVLYGRTVNDGTAWVAAGQLFGGTLDPGGKTRNDGGAKLCVGRVMGSGTTEDAGKL